jgi:catalase
VVDLVVNRPRAAVATLRRQRARLGVNFRQIPVNRPKSPVHSYSKDGAMRIDTVSDPVYAPNSVGGPKADPSRAAEAWLGYTGGEMVREAYTLHAEDDDYGQANTLVNKVMNDAERARLVSNVAGALTGVVSDEIRERAFQYWNNIDKPVGQRIEQAVRNGG